MAYYPYAKIQQTTTLQKTPGELLIDLFDGCLLDLSKAKIAIEEKDFAQANEMIQKSQKIVRYLNNTLNMSYPISSDLRKLYTYFDEQLIQCNLHKNIQNIDDIYPMIEELRSSFVQANKMSRMQAANM